MSDSTPTLERVAAIIHGAMVYAVREFKGEPQPWQNGNSTAESYARREARAALDASGNDGTKVPPLERPDYCEPHEFLLLASYCGDDNEDCTEARPCADCLALCNVFGEDGKFLREFDGYDPAIARTQEQSDGE